MEDVLFLWGWMMSWVFLFCLETKGETTDFRSWRLHELVGSICGRTKKALNQVGTANLLKWPTRGWGQLGATCVGPTKNALNQVGTELPKLPRGWAS